uniref:hypothetical protein n=1 Tax=Aeromonas sp. QDB11 TaxID=2990482 RepID=UPI0022E4E7D9
SSVGTYIRHFGTLMPFWGGATIPLTPMIVLTCLSDALGDSSIGSNTEVEVSSSDYNFRFILIFFFN